MIDDEWKQLMSLAEEFQGFFREGLVFIDGVAVYAHTQTKDETSTFGVQSYDAGFMVSLQYYVVLRDMETLTANRSLNKQIFIKRGFDFDVYVEGQADLCIPVPEAVAYSQVISGLRVACIEHLMILKAEALAVRRGTPKGDKHEDDLARLLLVADATQREKLTRLTDELLNDLRRTVHGDAVMRLANGDSHKAEDLRSKIIARFNEVEYAHHLNYESAKL